MWKELINTLSNFSNWVMNFFNSLSSIVSSIISIVQALFYWLITLLSAVWDLVIQIFEWSAFINITSTFGTISNYIWWPATVFIATIFFVIIVRIWIAFVFKIFRLNIDYHTKRSQTEKASIDDWRRSLKHLE